MLRYLTNKKKKKMNNDDHGIFSSLTKKRNHSSPSSSTSTYATTTSTTTTALQQEQQRRQQQQPSLPRKTKRMWACDVCCQVKFDNYNQACIHENACRLEYQQQHQQQHHHQATSCSIQYTIKSNDNRKDEKEKKKKKEMLLLCHHHGHDDDNMSLENYDMKCHHGGKSSLSSSLSLSGRNDTSSKRTTTTTSDMMPKPVHPFFVKTKTTTTTQEDKNIQNVISSSMDVSSNPSTTTTIISSLSSRNHHRKRQRLMLANTTTTTTTTQHHHHHQEPSVLKRTRPKKMTKHKTTISSSSSSSSSLLTPLVHIVSGQQQPPPPPTTTTAASTRLLLLAEQKAVEFAVQRRIQADIERERQKKRQLNAQSKSSLKQQQQIHKSSFASSSLSSFPLVQNSKSLLLLLPPPAIRFPDISHVGHQQQEEEEDYHHHHHHVVLTNNNTNNDSTNTNITTTSSSSSYWIQPTDLILAQQSLVKTLRHHAGLERRIVIDELNDNNDDDDNNKLSLPTTTTTTTTNVPMNLVMDPLQQVLMDTFCSLSPLVVMDRMGRTTTTTSSMDANDDDIYNVTENVCGKRNRETAQQLIVFVNKWKTERQRAHQRRANKQQTLLLRVNKKKMKRSSSSSSVQYRPNYNDLWCDSDYENDDNDGRLLLLPSVCLLTGPTGSCKTSLVHAVARQCNCRVLEINTTEKRGGSALKNAIEEATQSDSSLDMLKTSKSATSYYREDAWYDSDDNDTAEVTTRGSSVTVILIDEVDLMYEDEGDSGFWSALSSLTKKAKCPIVLTANLVPASLVSSSIRFQHLETSYPSPAECASKIQQIAQLEGLTLLEKFDDWSTAEEQLSMIARLCRCDVRRIINELHLFASAPPTRTDCGAVTVEASTVALASDIRSTFAPPVIITSVSPKQVSSHDFSLLTITGQNFVPVDSCDFKVSIGDQLCPAVKLMNACTILAVCPPCLIPSGISDSSIIEQSGTESRTLRFSPVSIRVFANGRMATASQDSIFEEQLCDGTTSVSLGPKWNIEYCFPPPRRGMLDCSGSLAADSDSEEVEFEGERTAVSSNVSQEPTTHPQSLCAYSSDEAMRILDEGVGAWKATNAGEPWAGGTDDMAMARDDESVKKMDMWSSLSGIASDAAMLEEGFERGGLPFLAGAVPGFGTSFVNNDAGHIRDANARPPSFDKLFSLGWNEHSYFFGSSDAYLRNPGDRRERKLLSICESMERGISRPLTTGPVASESFQDEYHLDTISSAALLSSESMKMHEAPRRVAEEDGFIKPFFPPPMLSLPSDLRRGLQDAGFETIARSDLARLPTAMQQKARQLAKLLTTLVENNPDPGSNRLVCSAERLTDVSATPFEDRVDRSVFLDYLPLLRSMATHERAAEYAFQQVCSSDPDSAAALSTRRRMTRRNKTMERNHYFVSIRSCQENSMANLIGKELAEKPLRY